ncbi:MAG: HAD-IIIA family hydrolase [Woeseiaceae bacterium]|nr:HAD-IIIA family hydrolase [Woeseiaceae bacterium]
MAGRQDEQLAAARLVILGRDGVLNHRADNGMAAPGDWRPIPGSADGVGLLTRAGYSVCVATNQPGIGRGEVSRRQLHALHRKMRRLAEGRGGRIDRVEVCPHGPDDSCPCRKPAPGMLAKLAKRLGVPLAGVPVVGDSRADIDAARAAGARPLLVRTGDGEATLAALQACGEDIECYKDLLSAAKMLSGDSGG